MNKNNLILVLCLLVLYCGFAYSSTAVLAEESSGGQVSTTSKISFYETEPTPEPTPNPKPNPKPTPNPLPQTGEALGRYMLVGFGVLTLAVGLFFIRKRREEEA